MTTEQWERENQDTLMEYFIDGDPSVRRIQCEYCRKVLYTQTRNRKYCSFRTCGHTISQRTELPMPSRNAVSIAA